MPLTERLQLCTKELLSQGSAHPRQIDTPRKFDHVKLKMGGICLGD
jgi:hypothetical protein